MHTDIQPAVRQKKKDRTSLNFPSHVLWCCFVTNSNYTQNNVYTWSELRVKTIGHLLRVSDLCVSFRFSVPTALSSLLYCRLRVGWIHREALCWRHEMVDTLLTQQCVLLALLCGGNLFRLTAR